jgi:HEPN superfamily Swt1-like protein
VEHPVRYFGLANVSLDNDLARIEREKKIQIRSKRRDKSEDSYYPQVPAQIRRDAKLMSEHYELFYCLESSIRDLIRTTLEASDPADWWTKLVPQFVRENAERNQTREIQAGVRQRSTDMLSYTNFGELNEIIKANWKLFADTFTDPKAVEGVLARLNMLRAPIAHCSMLAEDEIVRLRLSLRDWFQLMG